MRQKFRALVLSGPGECAVHPLTADELPRKELVVDVLYSSINYKDALAVSGRAKIIRGNYPFIPGIDLVGQVRSSASPAFNAGDYVILTGGGLGEFSWGGYSQVQAVDSKYSVPLPEGMSPRVSMILGTAGLTAMLSVMALEKNGVVNGDIVVTGASGGVGMLSVFLLSRLGYNVTASCRSKHLKHKLHALGAVNMIDRLSPDSARPLQKGRWGGAVDAAGGAGLAAVLAQIRRHGCVAVSGNAAGAALHTTVYPFILRGVTLAGIDSNTATMQDRLTAWRRLNDLVSSKDAKGMLIATVALTEVHNVCLAKVAGNAPGRFLVDVNDGAKVSSVSV